MLNRKIKINIGLILFLTCFLIFPSKAKAANDVQFEWDPDFPFTLSNMAPGQSETRDFRAKNISGGSDYQLYFTVNKTEGLTGSGGELLENMINVSISQGATVLAEKKLNEIYGNPVDFGILPVGGIYEYVLNFTFKSEAGNAYQNLNTKFDVNVSFSAVPVATLKSTTDDDDDDDDDDDPNDNPNNPTTNPPVRFFRALQAAAGAIAGEQTDEEEQKIAGGEGENPEVAGAVTTCKGWPIWVWILSIIVFALNFWRNARKNYVEEKYKWIFPLSWTIAAALFWYFFDKCREYNWFLYGSIIIAILSHFIYLYYLRKKVKKGLPIEKEEKTEENNISQ